ncbi:hypothetical protein GCM10007052_17890 [Halioglobus japonicus]|nr:hypothetical protein GCM10007052_17890 [Halioglobus japonicus]
MPKLRDGALSDSIGEYSRIVDPNSVIWRMTGSTPGPRQIINEVTEEIVNRIP